MGFNRIFGIGLSRTGTHSLCAALNTLKIGCIHWPLSMAQIRGHVASCDITVSSRFEQLDKEFPGSKFIYTRRDLGPWLKSCENHYRWLVENNVYGKLTDEQRAFALNSEDVIYGCREKYAFNAERFEHAYKQWEMRVFYYFEKRPNDLLMIDITKGDGWDKLLPFLGDGVSLRDIPFPHKGKAGE